MLIKFTLNKILLFSLLAFPITTLYQGLPGLDPLNRLWALGILALMFCGFLLEPIRFIDVFYLISGILLILICIIITGHPHNTTPITSFVFWFVFMCYIANNYRDLMRELAENFGMLKGVTLFWEISVFVSFFFSRSYIRNWGGVYFLSFSNALHRFAMTCFAIMAYVTILFIMTNKKSYLLWYIIPIVSMLLTGTRTYLVIGMVFVVAVYYISCKDKRTFYITILPLMVIAVALVLISPSGAKIIKSFQGEGYFGYWATLSNGRSIFWLEDLRGYWSLPIWKKFVGNGVNFIYLLNYYGTIAAMIWAHNDVINLLCTNGLLGVILYFVVFFSFVHRNKENNAKNTFVPLFVFYFTLGFNAMFNMLYTYTAAVTAIPFMYFGLYTLPNNMEYFRRHVNQRYLGEN
ncbi:hypothetical protein [Butyrivibrio sp. MB2005]|uniref:hypothetical protein n=1 Tax=Butyrivibrio sp. MB2005 TaxID=1280678 RepID=UPI0004075923|nr:hypothetical protein [Butyrivibrio sp. MB2005]